ncbi:hypothetical protein Acr_27g0003610 [Actinidia rufa]|uniref:F-box domain-containing protein n=1 Tax=Actinidia rufa TaxID=165716 RepID=A0A7J0H6B0_9ERIC|nr:hypothetical protein Acr_27g0003610 [Actinidia rufa]
MSISMSISDLPPHITIDILSRLPIKTIVQCKCVCKIWRNLLQEPYFVNLRLSRSPTTLIIHQFGHSLPPSDSDILKLVELEDDHDRHSLQYDPSTKFDLRFCYPNGHILLVGSVNGLICFCDFENEALFVCNPAVRQCVSLAEPKHKTRSPSVLVYGFGFSPVSSQYKVVQIFQKAIGPFSYECQESPESICSFDVEKELFQAFPCLSRGTLYKSFGLLGGCLCVCDNSSDSEFVVWTMKEYGIKESWTKELVIRNNSHLDRLSYAIVTPIKVWQNGDVLMLWRGDVLFSYSPERKTLEEVHVPRDTVPMLSLLLLITRCCPMWQVLSRSRISGQRESTPSKPQNHKEFQL